MKRLSGHTLPFAVLGHPIGHTLSPIMHQASFDALGLDAVYLAFDVAPAKLMNILPAMGDMGFKGVNLTVPLKEIAFEHISILDDSAKNLGAVNTVEFLNNGRLKGHNTDGLGFLAAFEEAFNEGIAGKSVFILGTGGAGRALAIACAGENIAGLAVTDIDHAIALKVLSEIQSLFPKTEVRAIEPSPEKWRAASQEADVVIQATPVGMKPSDQPLLVCEAFRAGQKVFDLIYMYPETGLLSEARRAGADISNGLGMLLHQGALAFEIWTGQKANTAAMRLALSQAVHK